LESSNSIPHHRVVREFQGSETIEELFVLRSQERQVGFVIYYLNRGRNLLPGFGALQLHVILVSHQVGGNENATLRKNSP
jgi:hypothetical protein